MRVSYATVGLLFLILAGLVMNPFFSGLAMAAPVMLPSGQVLDLSKEQLAAIKNQPGVSFSSSAPETLSGQVAVGLPEELGGGFIYGTPEALAGAFTTAGATVGTAAEIIAAGGLSTAAKIGIGVGLAGVVGAAAAAFSGDGGATTTAHH